MWQSYSNHGRAMLRLSLLLILLTHRIRTAYVTPPSFADRLDQLFEKLERLTVAPLGQELDSAPESLYDKLERLKSLGPAKDLSEEDEEVLQAMQVWGMLSADQLDSVVKEIQRMKAEPEEKSEKMIESEYGDEWNDEFQDIQDEGDYPMDANEDWNDYPDSSSTAKPGVVTPSAFTRLDTAYRVLSAVNPIAATEERPRILDDSGVSPAEWSAIRKAALTHIKKVVKDNKCLTPQPRWLSVRQMAPAAGTVYMPPCVQLHRCAPDTGCCDTEGKVCAPIDGKYVQLPFLLTKADGNITQARILFFNHTRCACVSRETLQSTVRTRIEDIHTNQYDSSQHDNTQHDSSQHDNSQHDNSQHDHNQHDNSQHDSSSQHDSNRIPMGVKRQIEWRSTEEPKLDEEPTAPPQLRRCTCPGLFLARMTDNGCSCVCHWPEFNKRRDCMSLARGKEHFGLRDRVCVAEGDCNPPSCEYGAYEKASGQCPIRKYRRIRYHRRFPKSMG